MNIRIRHIIAAVCIAAGGHNVWAQVNFGANEVASVAVDSHEAPVVNTALSLLERDYKAVFSDSLRHDSDAPKIIIGTVGESGLMAPYGHITKMLAGRCQAFMLKVLPDNRLLIAGSDSHGTAYGIMELSRLIGVSPWEWWADATPAKKENFTLPADYETVQSPSVEYRGIFINDEDWGLAQWARNTYEPGSEYGLAKIGPKTNEKIFELMLRLRANHYWPAMHECTEPFFLTKGNREMAEKYGIYIGGSHCEPMACSAAVEWSRRGKGAYDYVNNSENVYRFWEDRVKNVADQPILYTIGMRGVHDGAMEGAKTVEEQKAVIERVFRDQRSLLQKYVNPDVTKVPQVLIPYKEVLDIYNSGLEVPDDVTLMWCDDNYGYIRHFPTEAEKARKGGNGVYYHVSYWGRPHDYLWLGTFSPYLLYQQMKQAFDNGIQRIWILNVGDIKPAEYQTELFMDMAWNIDSVAKTGVANHMENFLAREFGEKSAQELLPVMNEHYRLAYIRKPEFLGNTRTEESPKERVVKDLPWSRNYILERLASYKSISDKAEEIANDIPSDRRDTYFQLVKYPVQAAAQMNNKMLYGQLARHGKADWSRSDAAFDSICALTRQYNTGFDNGGKWMRMIDHQPRRLPVFEPLAHSESFQPMLSDTDLLHIWNGADFNEGNATPCEGLGYEGKAVEVAAGKSVTFEFPHIEADSIHIEVSMLPNHPVSGDCLKFALSVDGDRKNTLTVEYQTKGRSEEWKKNVLTNRAVRTLRMRLKNRKKHTLTFTALTDGVVLDQIGINAITVDK